MEILSKLYNAGIIPVVAIEDATTAVPTAQAMLVGGIDVMEITFRTAEAEASIHAVTESCPEMLVGAGTVITLEQCKTAVDAGARFVVTPGFDEDIVDWCIKNDVPVLPGCITPTEIMKAKKFGLKVVKFFPAGVYGGLNAMKALTGPFGDIKFVPTGGINQGNLGEYMAAPFVHAVGGSWICPKKEISSGNYEQITMLCHQARQAALGFKVAHIGINCTDADTAMRLCKELEQAFGFIAQEGKSSIFSTSAIEVMKTDYLGSHGHIAIRTNRIGMAIAALERMDFHADASTAKYSNGRMSAIYLQKEFGGFAVHLLQK